MVGNIEWSGPIWYTFKGKMSDPDNMKILVSDFMLKDIGSGAYTEYEFGPEMVTLFNEKPHLQEMPMGHMHTHHQMNTFFSGTDMKCLHDNAPLFDMFLSVIVNTAGKRIAKIAVITKVRREVSYTRIRKLFSFKTKPEECLGIIDCDVEIEKDDVIAKEVTLLLAEKKERLEKLNARFTPAKVTTVTRKDIKSQLEMFDEEREEMLEEVKLRGDMIDNEELLTDMAIEGLLVRAINVDDLASSKLGDAVYFVNRNLSKEDHTLEISTIMAHFFDSLQSEYYYDQFGYVVRRAIELLDGHDKYPFVDRIIDSLKCWLDEFDGDDLDNGLSPDVRMEDVQSEQRYGGNRGNGEVIRYPETQNPNEF